jgi:hypothetical protein
MIKNKFDKILLPLHVNRNHFVVVEMHLSAPLRVKVWDSMCERGEGASWHSPFLTSFRQIIYGEEWDRVPMVVERDARDPHQPSRGSDGEPTKCCGPMAALNLANLAKGIRPSGYNHDDDAIMRTWILASIVERRLVALPQRRIGSNHSVR